ncbi:MAG: prolipoprotein diacylglyceryl transferase [Oscillospiraceae bacterium]
MNVTFPNIGLDLNINRIAFSVFGVEIYWYAILISIGMCIGIMYAYYNAPKSKIKRDPLLDIIMVTIIFGFIGARLYYVAFKFDDFKGDLGAILNIRNGGIAIYGGLIGGAIAMFIMAKIKKVNFLALLDLISPSLFIGQGIGRWGNFVNQEAFGTNTDSLFAMYSQGTRDYLVSQQMNLSNNGIFVDPLMPVHPTFLYESLLCALGLIILLVYKRNKKFNGDMICIYIGWYSLGRFFIEGLRTDSLMIGNFRSSQVLAMILVFVSVFLYYFLRNKDKNKLTHYILK